MTDCLFCKIISREIGSDKIYEDQTTYAFPDVKPITPGHVLVVPKVHAETLLDLPENQIGPLFAAVKKVTEMINVAMNPDGFNIGINMRKVAGQTVDHLHIHVIPRWENDGGGSIHSIVKNPPQEDIKTIATKIRKANE